MDQWLSVDQSYVAPHVHALVTQNIVRKHRGLTPEAEAVSAARAGLSHAFGVLDAALAGRPFLAGSALSLADLSLMPYVGSLPLVGAADLLDGLPALSSWWSRVTDRPSWRAVAGGA
jgi:glutathione S-transferase